MAQSKAAKNKKRRETRAAKIEEEKAQPTEPEPNTPPENAEEPLAEEPVAETPEATPEAEPEKNEEQTELEQLRAENAKLKEADEVEQLRAENAALRAAGRMDDPDDDAKYLKEPVVYMAIKGKGSPVKEHDLVLVHDQSTIVNGKVVHRSGKIAHFNPMYSTAVRAEVKILDRKVKRGAFMGLRIISLTAERKQIGEMARGMEQIDAMRALATDETINKLVKQRVKGKTNYMDLTRGEAHTVLTELQTSAKNRSGAAIAKKTSERQHLRESQPPIVKYN